MKRHDQGLVSRQLHDRLEVGAIVDARPPAGDFVLDAASNRPVVLVSAGVGLTPMVSMLHELVARGDERPIWFVHGARDGAHHALAEEVAARAAAVPNVRVHTAYSQPREQDREPARFQSVGRVDAALLESLLPDLDADFYVCGPTGFMASLQEGLESRGVASERIHSEAF